MRIPFKQFTPGVQNALPRAAEIMQQSNGIAIDVAHLMAALLEVDGMGRIAEQLGTNTQELRIRLNPPMRAEPSPLDLSDEKRVWITKELAQVLERASLEAARSGGRPISGEFILLAVVCYPLDPVGRILCEMGINEERVRSSIE
jgi:ATP-dependent Clp protease ATP-binding subunit ClpA